MTAVMDARLASLESELASVKAKADADAIDHEHVQQNMHARYAALESEHTAAVVERRAEGPARGGEGRARGREGDE